MWNFWLATREKGRKLELFVLVVCSPPPPPTPGEWDGGGSSGHDFFLGHTRGGCSDCGSLRARERRRVAAYSA